MCRRPAIWLYRGAVYAVKEVQICAWCIADGELGRHCKDRHVGFHDIQHQDVATSIAHELMQRTPGLLDPKPLPLAGLWTDLQVQAALTAAFGEPVPKGSGYGLVFREVYGPAYRVEIDLD